ncbi:MAG: hypothetical protein JSS75_00265 [Bacteroidetes bacterium]|nr:hypothetical protein [Bacteroidota bacterium]
MYLAFKVIHIFCASMTLGLLPLGFWFRSYNKKVAGTPAELIAIASEFGIGRFMGMIGGIGLLITGGAMAGIAHYGWFDFTNYGWLAWKQTIYIVILAVNFGTMMPVAKKTMPLVMGQIKSGGLATDEIRSGASKAAMIGIIMNALGIINLILGTVKP